MKITIHDNTSWERFKTTKVLCVARNGVHFAGKNLLLLSIIRRPIKTKILKCIIMHAYIVYLNRLKEIMYDRESKVKKPTTVII